MKNLIKLLFIIPAFLMFNCGGSDDDNDNDGNNSNTGDNVMMLGDLEYDLEGGDLTYYGGGDDCDYNFDVNLATSISGDGCDAETMGAVIYFEMWTSNQNHLDDGYYTFDDGNLYCLNGTISYADYDNGDGNWIGISTLSVNVDRSGSIYEISWDGEADDGTVVMGSYEGSLEFCDYSDEDLDSNNSSKRRSKK